MLVPSLCNATVHCPQWLLRHQKCRLLALGSSNMGTFNIWGGRAYFKDEDLSRKGGVYNGPLTFLGTLAKLGMPAGRGAGLGSSALGACCVGRLRSRSHPRMKGE